MFLDLDGLSAGRHPGQGRPRQHGVGLEVRAPLLDHRVVEFAWRLPLRSRCATAGQGGAAPVLARYVPRDLVERPKQGFVMPLDDWLRGPLRDWAEALLDERRLRLEGVLDPGPIRRAGPTT